MAVETGILLESGTNELELLEFVVGTQHYGINVAKINELCPYQEPTRVPNAHEYIEGIFMPRDRIITVIDLAKALGIRSSGDTSKDMYIITNFNRLHTAFLFPRLCREYTPQRFFRRLLYIPTLYEVFLWERMNKNRKQEQNT